MSESTQIPREQWKWHGYPGHFICATRCKFHLCTSVGSRLISTVGDMRIKNDDDEPSPIGFNRLYETYVFETNGTCDCAPDCGMPRIVPREIEGIGANTHQEAAANHMAMCEKYAAIAEVRAGR